jgi:hypothetical protein
MLEASRVMSPQLHGFDREEKQSMHDIAIIGTAFRAD